MYSNNQNNNHSDPTNTSGTVCILVANSNDAKLYTALKKDLCATNLDHIELALLKSHTNPHGRMKNTDLISDSPGRYANKNAPKSAFESADAHEHEKEKFAKELVAILDEKHANLHFVSCILVCAPPFYGVLNKHLSKSLVSIISHVIEKDYTKVSQTELIAHLKNALALK